MENVQNADTLDLSKENIQPLKRGRNTGQLTFALQAQSDATLQEMLKKKKEWYEMQLRTYEGPDPLEVWCEYISWMEQSYPKHGPEANLEKLLMSCFQALKDNERYKNDVRFVRLWIKYIEMNPGQKHVELFQLLSSQGVGLRCAEFYKSWAYEYETAGDWKQADAIYRKGLDNMAQPAEELKSAHQTFSAALVMHLHKNKNNDAPDELENNPHSDHRMAMAELKPCGKKSTAPNVRVGSSVKNHLPGVVTSLQGSSTRPPATSRSFGVRGNNAGCVIYQGEPEPEPTFGQNVPTAVHLPQSLNKENIVKAGPWTGQGLGTRKHQTSTFGLTLPPKQPGFEVHKDEDADAASSHDVRPLGVTVPHALQPHKRLEDGFHDAMTIFDDPNKKNDKAMYRKHEVYGGGKEFQLEEIHALDYWKRNGRERPHIRETSFQSNHAEENGLYSRKLSTSTSCPSSNGIDKVESQDGDKEMVEFQELHSPRHLFKTENSAPVLGVEASMSSYQQQHHQPLAMYGSNLEAVASAHCSPEVHHEHPPQGHRFQPSNHSLSNQSMTVHTKLATLEVDNYWSSPTVSKTAPCGPSIPASPATDMYHPQSEFHAMRDGSLSQQVHENSSMRHEGPQPYPQNQFCKPRDETYGSVAPPTVRGGHFEPSREMEPYPIHPSDNYRHFENPMAQPYMKHHNGFHPYQEEPYPTASQQAKFTVFRDETENAAPARSLSGERTDLSSSIHTPSSSIQKIAREKENIHKFPQADIELHEDYGAASIPERPEQLGWQQQPSDCNYNMGAASYAPPLQSQPLSYMDHSLHGHMHPHPISSHDGMSAVGHIPHSSHTVAYDAVQGGATYAPMQHDHSMPYGAAHHNLMYPSYIPNQALHEPMEDDATVAAAPSVGVNMSETGITEAFFYPNMGAVSTPYQTSPKKSRASKNPVDFDSSLYRCELSWTEEEGVDCHREDAPKKVPPMKIFRIRNDGDQLSAIMESSKEKYQSVLSSGSCSTSAFVNNRHGMQTTFRQSLQPQPCLNQIEESSEPLSSSSSSQEGQAQVQVPPVQGPNLQQMHEMSMRLERGEINPFDNRLLEYFLYKMSFPLPHHADGYHSLSNAVPAKRNNCLNLGGTLFSVSKVLGEGAYAKVLKAVNTSTQKEVALKIQKPGCRWEYYICREIQHRLSQQNLASAFMPADQIFVYNNGSIIVTDLLPFGTLLNLVNKVVANTKRPLQENQALFLLDQLISAVKALHDCKIIHGDLKPDNVLLRAIPTTSQTPCIQLIDFGRSIDMELMPAGTTFNQVVMTDTFTCIEMRTNKPWTYQTDLFNLANTAHCLLFGNYMNVQEIKSTGRWAIQSKLPRNVNSEFWGTFFDTLLNIESCDALPDLETLRADVQSSMSNTAQLQLAVSALGRLMLSR